MPNSMMAAVGEAILSITKMTALNEQWLQNLSLDEKVKSNWHKRKENENAGARTQDLRIKSPLLYRLSYILNVPNG
jgi:hypothetical protein